MVSLQQQPEGKQGFSRGVLSAQQIGCSQASVSIQFNNEDKDSRDPLSISLISILISTFNLLQLSWIDYKDIKKWILFVAIWPVYVMQKHKILFLQILAEEIGICGYTPWFCTSP